MVMQDMVPLSNWLANTQLSAAIADTAWAVPALQTIHILAISMIMTSIAMLDLRLSGVIGREHSLRNMSLRFYTHIWGALAVLVSTGLLQIMAEPARELLNWIFWTKMGLIVAAVLVTLPVRRLLEDCRFRDLPSPKRAILRAAAILSLLCWVAIVICGRWIAYAGEPV
jgi:uncharacterized membrane protein